VPKDGGETSYREHLLNTHALPGFNRARDRGLGVGQRATGATAVAFKRSIFPRRLCRRRVAIPAVAAKFSLTPSGRDDTRNIQAALDAVGKLPPGADDFAARCCCAVGRFGSRDNCASSRQASCCARGATLFAAGTRGAR